MNTTVALFFIFSLFTYTTFATPKELDLPPPGPTLSGNEHYQSQVIKIKIAPGDTLYSILGKNGIPVSVAGPALAELPKKEIWPLTPKQVYWRVPTTNGFELKFFDPQSDRSINIEKSKSKVSATVKQERFRTKVVTVKGKVKGSIISSIMELIPSQNVAYRFLDAYRFDYKLHRILRKNADFTLTVEQHWLGSHLVKYGEVLKTEIQINDDIVTRYFLKTPSGGSFVSIKNIHENRPLYAPVEYIKVSSEFQPRRRHPITKKRIPHMGIDFELPSGEPVYTSLEGTVLRTGKNRAAGRYVVIAHKNNIETYYNHLSYIQPNIKPGVRVTNGQIIGSIGCSGYCTKPHLHFATKVKGRFVNPNQLLKTYTFIDKSLLLQRIAQLKEIQEQKADL